MPDRDPNQPNPAPGQARRYCLVSLGCAKNLVEGEHIAGMLMAQGLAPTADPEEADVLVVNTCGFIRPAVEESVDAILELAQAKRPGQTLAVVGCLVGRYGKKLAAALPEADLLVSPGKIADLPTLLAHPPADRAAMAPARGVLGAGAPRSLSTGPGWAYLRVADGCDHRCAFCTIPAIRGKPRSRPLTEVLDEARELAKAGVREINLVAQDLTGYGRDLEGRIQGQGLVDLLHELNVLPGIDWVRMHYLHPDFVGDDLISAVAGLDKVLPYFDLPLQHIADLVLKAMRRQRTGAELRALVAGIRAALPHATLRATLMTGHPGEGEAEFAQLMEFVAWAQLDHLGCFAFEPEEGTASAKLPAVDYETGVARREQVMAAQKKISHRRLAAKVGAEEDCLILGEHPESEHLWHGRLASQAPEVDGLVIITDGSAPPGELARVRITASHDYDLEGVIL